LRKGEIQGLGPEHVHAAQGLLSIERQLLYLPAELGGVQERRPKDNSSRVIPAPVCVLEELLPLVQQAARAGWRFVLARPESGHPPRWKDPRSGLWRWLVAGQHVAGVDPLISIHGMRRTAYTLWIEAGVPPAIADAWLGHKLRGASQIGWTNYWSGGHPEGIDQTILARVRADAPPSAIKPPAVAPAPTDKVN
jgi:integrase